ncbi:pericentriolar material 1 protein-like [Diadema antillarum]|uniref:pericentriolar material 1 protein-like n=1 Tax=Diadema antillarum TaxID=105358 RepID=UPI003A85CDDC
MAAGQATQLPRGVMSEPRIHSMPRYNALQSSDDRFLFNSIGGDKEESKPNNYYNWKPSSTFAEQPSSVVRSKKSKNREREQNSSGQQLPQRAMSNGPSRRRTPATYPRTQQVASFLEREELENLRHQLTFSDVDDQSTDSQIVGTVSSANRANNVRPSEEVASIEGASKRPSSVLDTIFVNEMPDRNKIVARLMQIRDYLRQASAMMSTLQNSTESPERDDQVDKLIRLQEHLQEQERGYLALLERMLAEEIGLASSVSGVESITSNDLNVAEAAVNGRSSQNSGESFSTSVAESASINIDAQSDISEATTEGTLNARTRPRIESHLGNHSCASDNDISDSEASVQDDAHSVASSQATGSFGLDTQELHEQYSSMLQKYQEGDEDSKGMALGRMRVESWKQMPTNSVSSQTSSVSTASPEEGQKQQDVSDQIAALEGLRKQHDLLKKMLKQQEELRTLQSRQAALMTLQTQIESRLNHSEQERPDETLSVSTQATTTTATTATSATEDIAPVTTTAGVGSSAAGVPLTASDLQERRRTLMRMLAEQRDSRAGELQQARTLDWMDHSEVSPPLISAEHQELREKLDALQEKKRQMDELLSQLHALHPFMSNTSNADSLSVASTSSNLNENVGVMVSTKDDEASDLEATLTNGPDSLRKLHEVRERLTELRDLVQQYQDTSQLLDAGIEGANNQQQQERVGLAVNYEDPDLMSNLRKLQRGEQVGRLSQVGSNQISFSGDGAHVQVGSGQTTSTVTETETETETESNHSSILAAWGEDPEIKEKVRKLKEAKQKLRQLQSLVAMVQQTPEVATALPDDLAELAADLTAGFSDQDPGNEDEEEDDDEEEEEEEEDTVEESESGLLMGGGGAAGRDQVPSSLSEGEIPPDFARETKEAYYEAKMNQQRRELQSLMAERHRLLSVQQQLKELNDNLTPVRKQPAKQAVKSVNIQQPPVAARSAQTNMNVVATPSRDEVYAEMRRNRMLQEELRQKKNELSDLLSIVKRNRERLREGSELGMTSAASDLAEYDNDLFRELLLDAGRLSMRSADITAAATWGGSTQVSDDEGLEDGYPSDGIVQVEEEEEQEQSIVTSDTYTIESGMKPRKRPQVSRSYPGIRRVALEDDGETSSMDAARHGIRYPKNINTALDRQSRLRQENIRSAEELVSDSQDDPLGQGDSIRALQGHIQQLQQQLSNSMGLCQTLISDQQSMSNLLSGSLNAGTFAGLRPTTPSAGLPPNPFSTSPQVNPSMPQGPSGDPRLDDLMVNYNVRLQHQQLMLNLSSAYNQLYRQQEEIQRLNQQLDQASEVSFDVSGAGRASAGINANANNNAPPLGSAAGMWGPRYSGQTPPFRRLPGFGAEEVSPYGGSPYNPGMPFSMAPTFPPGFGQPGQGNYPSVSPYTNPYTTNNLNDVGPGSRKDSYTLYARQPAGAARQQYGGALGSYHVPPNTAQVSNDDDEFEAAYLNGASSHKASRLTSGYTLDSGIGDVNELLGRESTLLDPRKDASVPPLDISSLLRRTEEQRKQREDMGSQRSNASSSKGGKHPMPSSAAQARAQLSSQSKPSARLAKMLGPKMGQGLSSSISGTAFLDTASIASTLSMSSLPGEFSDRANGRSKDAGRQGQQQAMQQDTDRSVRSQTSELESDAGSEFSLFEALRESIYSEVASLISQNESRPHFLIELFRELQMLNSDYLRQRALYALQDLVSKYLTDDNTNPSEAATLPSERSLPAWMNFIGSEQTPSESFITSDEEEIKARLFGANLQRSHESSYAVMLEDDQYDYIENVDSASTLSTPPSTGPGEFGFANDDLGDTVIHLDKALKRMREYERMKAEAEGASGTTSSMDKDRAAMSASDMTSNSSAQDMGSESSFSDLPYPRIDTRQLDLQIKGIMQEVIPYLKEHMDDVCSPQLLAYIRRLVLGLARQKDESREFVRFFNRQLGSILEDSLAKFSGRKMRECGEDLLVDISEILFNELAFFRLMQDLDTAGNKLKQEAARDNRDNDEDDDDEEEDDDQEEEEEEEGDENAETGTETGTAQDQATGEEGESSSDDSSTDEEDEEDDEEDEVVHQTDSKGSGSQQAGGMGSQLMEDALASAMAVASKFEEEELGNARDDLLATQLEISDRDEDSEPQGVDHLQIELSMSESKGVTYIGSGEEEDDPDNLGEVMEETITSIGAAKADGEEDSVDDTTASTEILVDAVNSSQRENALGQESPERDTAADTKTSDAPPVPGAGVGENNNEEITVDDLPAKLNVLSTSAIENQMSKEQVATDGIQGVIETMATGEAQLAGDPLAIRPPEGTPMENGIMEASAEDIGSE